MGERGAGDGQFTNLGQIAVDPTSGRVFAIDYKFSATASAPLRFLKVKKFTAAGNPVDPAETITLQESTANPFPIQAKDIAVDQTAGVLYVLIQSRTNSQPGGTPLEVWRYPLNASGAATPIKYVLDAGTPETDDDLNIGGAMTVNPASGDLYIAGADDQATQLWRLDPAAGGLTATKSGGISLAAFEAVSDLGFRDDKLYLFGVRTGGGSAVDGGRVGTLTAALGATGDPFLEATAETGDRPFGVGNAGAGLGLEPGGAILLPDRHPTDDGGVNFNTLGVVRFTSLASTTVNSYWGNNAGTEPCTFSVGPSAIAFNSVSGEILVSDNNSSSSSGSRRIQRFKAGGTSCGFEPPKSQFSISANPTVGQDITFTSLSTLPKSKPAFTGSFTAFRWDFGDDGSFEVDSASASTVTRKLPVGTTKVKLEVEVTGGEKASFTRDVVVKGIPPVASFTIAPGAPRAGDSVTFNAAGSTPPAGGTITGYRWDFGDGATTGFSSSPTTTHTYGAARSYRVKLEVREAGGEIDVEEKNLSVSAPPADPPAPPAPNPPAPNPPIPGAGDLVAPVIVLKGGTFTPDKKGVFNYSLSCPATETSCVFAISVSTAKAVAAQNKKKRVLALTKGKLTVTGGKAGTVKLKISASGLKALRKLKRVPVKFTVGVTDAAGNSATKTQTATILAPKKR